MNKLFSKRNILVFILLIVVVLAIFLIVRGDKEPSVLRTDPTNGAQEVLETSQVNIFFNEDIGDKTKDNVSIETNPKIEFDSTWLTNSYKAIPKKLLENSKKYTINVLYKNKVVHTFSFETATFSQEAILKYGPQQSEDDFRYGESLKDLIKNHPWYPNLPIKTKDYVVYYDFDLEKFAITFLDSTVTQAQKDLFIKDALLKIKRIGGVDPIQYYTQP